ncbi:hypothetical protein SCHPADRAFT_992650 [Schizopora paradoxa]|uniref:Uncharacterized protein n=1 Tax=Schizopora paradoxa TaxID=27342 RepID=A0A0H2S603_9AGAM|nr:hypothetical protein SCHPADRAFT_992650 [Schizopora paradoxa]
MPHKRAKKSVRDKERDTKKSDLPPSQLVSGFQNDGGFPKSAAWVLNAEAVRSAYREKRKREADGGDDDGKRKRKRKATNGQGETDGDVQKAKASLTIKPGESLKHFNRRVEDDMRPLVRTAMSSTASASRQKRNASEKDDQTNAQTPERPNKSKSSHIESQSEFQRVKSTKPAAELKDFDRLVSSAPKRLNDIVQAPPQLSIGSRLKSKSKSSSNSSGDKSDNVISVAQKRMMDLEREKAIARYRALKTSKHDAS